MQAEQGFGGWAAQGRPGGDSGDRPPSGATLEPRQDDRRRLALKRGAARRDFLIHLALYVLVNAGLILAWATHGGGYPWFVWPLLGWGVGISAQGLALAAGPGSAFDRWAMDRELRRLRPPEV